MDRENIQSLSIIGAIVTAIIVALVFGYIPFASTLGTALLVRLLQISVYSKRESKQKSDQRKAERLESQLRVYSEVDEILSNMLDYRTSYYGVEVGERYADLPSEMTARIDELLRTDAYLFDQRTKDHWRNLKLYPVKPEHAPKGKQMVKIELVAELRNHVRSQIEELRKALNLGGTS